MSNMMEAQPYFREREIQEVLVMLKSSPGVAVIGKYGAGKSSFMAEFFRYCKEHNIPSSQRLYDGHNLTSTDRAKKETDDLVSELLVANDGRQRMMLVDSGDYFYLPKGMIAGPSYNSAEYMRMREALTRPNGLEELTERITQEQFDPNIIRREHSGREYDNNEITRQVAEEMWVKDLEQKQKYTHLEVASSPRERFKRSTRWGIDTRLECFEQCGRAMRELGYSLESERVRAVLTYHSTFRFGKASDDRYKPDPGLGATFAMYLAPHLTNFHLPEAYEPDKARLYLQTVKGLQNPERIWQVLLITGGQHGVMKLAIQGPNEGPDPFGIPRIKASELEKMTPRQVETIFKPVAESVRRQHLRWE